MYSCASKVDDSIFLLESIQPIAVTTGWQISKVRKANTKFVYSVNFAASSDIDGAAFGAMDVLPVSQDQEIVFMAGSQSHLASAEPGSNAVEIAKMQFNDDQLDCRNNMC